MLRLTLNPDRRNQQVTYTNRELANPELHYVDVAFSGDAHTKFGEFIPLRDAIVIEVRADA